MSRYLDQRLKLRLLRSVDAIVAQKSLLKGAQSLGVSQPSLSKGIKELEQMLGTPLFERHARGVTPTAPGAAVAESAKRVLAELSQLDEELSRLASQSSGTIMVGALPTAASGLLPGALARMKLAYPNVEVQLVQGQTEELLPLLAAGDVDFIVGRLYRLASQDSFAREVLYEEPISVLARAGHPIFLKDAIELGDLADFNLVLPTYSQRIVEEIAEFMAALDLPSGLALRSTATGFIRELILSTDYITIAPQLNMAGDLLRGIIRVVPLPVVTQIRSAGLIYRRDRPLLPNAQTLAGFIRAYVAELFAHS